MQRGSSWRVFWRILYPGQAHESPSMDGSHLPWALRLRWAVGCLLFSKHDKDLHHVICASGIRVELLGWNSDGSCATTGVSPMIKHQLCVLTSVCRQDWANSICILKQDHFMICCQVWLQILHAGPPRSSAASWRAGEILVVEDVEKAASYWEE